MIISWHIKSNDSTVSRESNMSDSMCVHGWMWSDYTCTQQPLIFMMGMCVYLE